MGRVIQKHVIGLQCELRSCQARLYFAYPVSAPSTWHDELAQLGTAVAQGWALILTPQLRAYCSRHADRVNACSCKTHPNYTRTCPVHGEAQRLVWTEFANPPQDVQDFTDLAKGV